MKRIISFVLCFVLVLSLFNGMSINVLAAGESITATVQGEYLVSNEAQDVTIRINVNNLTLPYCGFYIGSTTIPEGFAIKSFATSYTTQPIVKTDYNLETGKLTYDETNTEDKIPGETYYDVVITVPANASGDYAITFNKVEVGYDQGFDTYVEADAVTTTLSITEPEEETDPYEIYYTLDKADGTDGDKYHEYGIDDTVTANVYIKNTGDSAVNLQAYDIYLTYDNSNLTYTGTTLNSGVAYNAAGVAYGKEGFSGTVSHIQAVGKDTTNTGDTEKPISVALPVNTDVPLGTITFDINDTAVYNTAIPITLTVGKDSKTVTNIGVGTNDANGGDKTSYYPVNTSTVLGAEVMTTYTVTYDANGGTFAENAVTTQTKQHNVDLTIAAPATPTREGFSFVGWSTESGDNNAANKVTEYSGNEAKTFYAIWEKNTVTVIWMNGEVQYGEKDEIEYNTIPTAPDTNPSKDKTAQYTYTFLGWSTNPNATAAETLTAVTEDTTYHAIYSATTNKYTVTWYPQAGGTALETDSNVEYGTKPSYDGENPTKEQDNTYTYTFAGWATSANQESGTFEENLIGISGDTAYYAAFSKTERVYTVSFSDGTQAITGGYNASVTLPSTATAKSGYTFSGWNTVQTPSDGNLGTSYAPGASYTVTGDVTLYAQYTANTYIVKFNANDGSGTMNDQRFTYDVAQKLTANGFTAPIGKTFNGWNTNSDGTGTTYNNEQEVSNLVTDGEITLYAQWTDANYKVSKGEVQNGTLTVSKEAANYNEAITVTVSPAAGYSIDTVSYTPENGGVTTINPVDGVYSFTMPAANVTVNATFKANDYTVTVVTEGNGSVEANKTSGVHVDETIELTVTLNTGYKLSVLTYTDADGKAQSIVASDGEYTFTMPAADTTVTATFVGIDYIIKFDANGGDGNMNNINAVYGTEYTPTNAFTKTGYTFVGWTTTADGTNPQMTVTNLTTLDGATVTLYAQWTAAQVNYTVNYWQQNIGGGSDQNNTNFTKQDADTVTKTATADSTITVAPEKVYTGFTTPADATNVTIAADGTTVVDFYYIRNTYTITFKDGETTYDNLTITKQYGDTVTAPADPTKDGYSFKEWSPAVPSTMPATNTIISPTWDLVTYNITYKDGETTLTGLQPATYTIESGDKLPTYSKTNYIFKGWKVTETVENSIVWAKDAVFSADVETVVTGKHGDVTLTAQWDTNFTYKVEEYKYADSGHVMLRIATSGNSNAYTFGDVKMFYTDDVNYKIDGQPVFVTLIPKDGNVNADWTLTDVGVGELEKGSETATAVSRDGKINDDSIVNIADANIVYQMIVNGGGYYGNQLLTDKRLGADMVTDADGSSTHRATIDDVHRIVGIINGTTTTN